MHLKNKKLFSKKYLIIILLIFAALITWVVFQRLHTRPHPKTTPSTTTGSGGTYSPPTAQEQQAGDQQKEINDQKQQAQKNSSQTGEKTVSVIITDAGQYDDKIEVRAFIPDYYQDGTCKITITKDSYTVSKSTPAYHDVSTTICTNPLFSRSEFPVSGQWQVVVTYTAAGAKGTSAPKNITIH